MNSLFKELFDKQEDFLDQAVFKAYSKNEENEDVSSARSSSS